MSRATTSSLLTKLDTHVSHSRWQVPLSTGGRHPREISAPPILWWLRPRSRSQESCSWPPYPDLYLVLEDARLSTLSERLGVHESGILLLLHPLEA
jgi:hypothetical protein